MYAAGDGEEGALVRAGPLLLDTLLAAAVRGDDSLPRRRGLTASDTGQGHDGDVFIVLMVGYEVGEAGSQARVVGLEGVDAVVSGLRAGVSTSAQAVDVFAELLGQDVSDVGAGFAPRASTADADVVVGVPSSRFVYAAGHTRA